MDRRTLMSVWTRDRLGQTETWAHGGCRRAGMASPIRQPRDRLTGQTQKRQHSTRVGRSVRDTQGRRVDRRPARGASDNRRAATSRREALRALAHLLEPLSCVTFAACSKWI
jgi:hypothetical protein